MIITSTFLFERKHIMKNKTFILTLLATIILSGNLYAEVTYTIDPLTKTITIGGDGEITWSVGQAIQSDYVAASSTGKNDVEHIVFAADSNITKIGGAFQNYYNLKSVALPNTITTIGGYSFAGCSSLTDINFPNSLTRIEDRAFNGARKLENVVLPSSILYIGPGSFSDTAITSIDVPASATVDKGAFNGPHLSEITLSPNQLIGRGASAYERSKIDTYCDSDPTVGPALCAEIRDYFDKNSWANTYWGPASVFGNLDLSNVIINCRGDAMECENAMRYLNYGTKSDQRGDYNLVQKLSDGSMAIYKEGKLVGYKGKRIYTVEEANKVSGKVNTVKLRYK